MKDNIETEAIETCPYCGAENIYPNWDVQRRGYVAECQECGEKIMLCDECRNSDDNKERYCDWHKECNKNGYLEKCFRGYTYHEEGKTI